MRAQPDNPAREDGHQYRDRRSLDSPIALRISIRADFEGACTIRSQLQHFTNGWNGVAS
jgi:hypothetical protein